MNVFNSSLEMLESENEQDYIIIMLCSKDGHVEVIQNGWQHLALGDILL